MNKLPVIEYALENSIRQASKRYNVPRSTISDWLKKYKKGEQQKPTTQNKTTNHEKNEVVEEKDKLSIDNKSFDIKTLDQLIAYSKIDTDVWEAVKVTTNKWEVFSNEHGNKMLYQIKAEFRRRKTIEDAKEILNAIVDKACRKAPNAPPKLVRKASSLMLDLSIADHHFGKLSWGKQVGEDYDVGIASRLYLEASQTLLDRSPDIESILYVVGNDLLHCDNALNRTHSGNPLDSDTRWENIFLKAFESIKDSILYAREKAPVNVVIVPGNHDMEKTFCIGHSLCCYFHNFDDVTIDNSPSPRKYYRYGVNLIGMTHGSEESHRDLPLIMAQERKEDWSKTEYRQWKIGHFHKKKQTSFVAGDTLQGVEVVVSPSLCAADTWHHQKGYVGNVKSAVANLWDKNTGLVGTLQHNCLRQ